MIDFHTHIFPDRIAESTLNILKVKCETEPETDATAAGLRESSRKAGVDCSVILPVATRPGQFTSINRFAEQFKGDDRLLSFGGIHPGTSDYNPSTNLKEDSHKNRMPTLTTKIMGSNNYFSLASLTPCSFLISKQDIIN